MKKFFFLTIYIFMCSYMSGQQHTTDSLTLEFKEYETTEQDLGILGKQKVILGTVIVKKGNTKIATHEFLVPIKKDVISHIAVLDKNGQRIDPRIHYDSANKLFTYYEGTEKEQKIKVKDSFTQKDSVLFGLWIWASLFY